ncbi:MAG: hypothetical protein ABIO70_21980 [Pseudomonadota bacterium]
MRIVGDGEERRVPLAAATVLGRHEGCTWVLRAPQIPSFWVELRWSAAGWLWRDLGGDARGPRREARAEAPGWWLLGPGQRLNGRGVVLELLDEGAPERFAVALDSGDVVQGEALLALVAEDAERPLPADWERRDEVVPLRDGQTFTVGGRAFRFHDAVPPPATARRRLDLTHPACRIELLRGEDFPQLHIWDGPASLTLRGAYLWALAPYLEARIVDMPREGWLDLDAAFSRWRELHPQPGSDPERVGQDRSRVCRALHARGVANASALFARRRLERRWQVRVALEPEQTGLTL